MTQLSEILKLAGNAVFTVKFTKKVDEEDIVSCINKLLPVNKSMNNFVGSLPLHDFIAGKET